MSDRTDTEVARNCILHMRGKGNPRWERTRIARMTGDACGHRSGSVVLVTDVYDRKCVIERPYTADQIKAELARGSALVTGNPCVGVPLSFVEFLSGEFDFRGVDFYSPWEACE